MTGYDVQRLTAAGPVTMHHDGELSTDGPWLIVGPVAAPVLIVPATSTVAVTVCAGGCREAVATDGG